MSELMALHDEEMFFEIVQTTPDIIEAMDMCRRSVHAVRRKQAQALADKDMLVNYNCARVVERLRNEITYLGQLYDATNIRKAVKSIFGIEGMQQVDEWCAMTTEMKRKEEITRDAGKNSAKPLSEYSEAKR